MAAREFKLDLDREYEELVNKGVVRALQTITFKLHEKIVRRTPVDTGAARASWHVSVGQVQYQTKGNTLAAVSLDKVEQIYITNAMEYISALENGHSQQAPEGMVALSIAEIETEYRRVS